jgi:hypothetical protein
MSKLADNLQEAEREYEAASQELAEAERDQFRAIARVRAARERNAALANIVTGLRQLQDAEKALLATQERLPVDEAVGLPFIESKTTVYGFEGDPPRGKEAVRLILSEVKRDWRASDLVDEVIRRGWIDPDAKQPDAAVRVAIRRLVDDGLAMRVAQGIYRAKDPGATPEEGGSERTEPETPDEREERGHAAASEVGTAP